MKSFEKLRNTFANLVPEMTRIANAAFHDLEPDAREEAVQNTLALTWKSYHTLIQQGRGSDTGIIRSVLWYSIRRTKVGRTMLGTGDKIPRCVFDYAMKSRVKFEKIDVRHFVSDTTPIPDAVSFRIDVPDFLSTLSHRQQRMAQELIAGETTSAVAAMLKVTPGAVSQFRVRFKELFDTYMAS